MAQVEFDLPADAAGLAAEIESQRRLNPIREAKRQAVLGPQDLLRLRSEARRQQGKEHLAHRWRLRRLGVPKGFEFLLQPGAFGAVARLLDLAGEATAQQEDGLGIASVVPLAPSGYPVALVLR